MSAVTKMDSDASGFGGFGAMNERTGHLHIDSPAGQKILLNGVDVLARIEMLLEGNQFIDLCRAMSHNKGVT